MRWNRDEGSKCVYVCGEGVYKKTGCVSGEAWVGRACEGVCE